MQRLLLVVLALSVLPFAAIFAADGNAIVITSNPVTRVRESVTQVRTYANGDQTALNRDPKSSVVTSISQVTKNADGSTRTVTRDAKSMEIKSITTSR